MTKRKQEIRRKCILGFPYRTLGIPLWLPYFSMYLYHWNLRIFFITVYTFTVLRHLTHGTIKFQQLKFPAWVGALLTTFCCCPITPSNRKELFSSLGYYMFDSFVPPFFKDTVFPLEDLRVHWKLHFHYLKGYVWTWLCKYYLHSQWLCSYWTRLTVPFLRSVISSRFVAFHQFLTFSYYIQILLYLPFPLQNPSEACTTAILSL